MCKKFLLYRHCRGLSIFLTVRNGAQKRPRKDTKLVKMTRNRGPRLTKTEAEKAVRNILADSDCVFHLLPFSEYRKSFQGSNLKSQQCSKYYALCHMNTVSNSGWFVCPYVLTRSCPVQKGVMEFDSRKGGTDGTENISPSMKIRTHNAR